ncbi:MAG: phosphatase PAP2 family protein [Pseudomonadota bacterium]
MPAVVPQAVLIILFLLLFNLWPELDLAASHALFEPDQGFFLKEHWLTMTVYRSVNFFSIAYAAVLIGIAACSYVWRESLAHMRPAAWFLLLALAIGPGLATHNLFKNNWGRPRPIQTAQFGGVQDFVAAGRIGEGCRSNCSFVSGHAAMGFYLLAIGYVIRQRKRFWHIAGIVAGLCIGAVRVAQGKHFVSDVLFTYFVVWACSLALYALMSRLRGASARPLAVPVRAGAA